MRDYWFTQDLLRAAGIGFILLSLAGIGLALWLPKKWWGKLLAVVAVGVLIAIPVRKAGKEMSAEAQEQQAREKDYKERYAKAKALFDERCKTAGEKVYRTVDNVEGVMLLKVRLHDDGGSHPMMAGAAAAHESYGDYYIRSFLLFERDDAMFPGRTLVEDTSPSSRPGYRFVEVTDPKDGKRYRYTLTADMRVQREETNGQAPRYAVTFDDIINPDERKYWIAGSIVKVIDLQTQETMGEFMRYVMDVGQGSQAGQRLPWNFAHGCNMATSYGSHSPRFFADQVLKPIKGVSK